MPKLHELQEKRAAIVVEMRSINDKAEKEKRDYSEAEDKRHKELKGELVGLDKQIERARDVADAERAAPAIMVSGRLGDGAFEQRAQTFSITKAIGNALGEDIDAGFEREISAEVKRRSGGRKFQGIAIPDQVFLEKRAFGDYVMTIGEENTTMTGVAAPLYPTMHRPDLFIDRLRSAIVVGRLGATVLDGLVGDQSIPRQTGSATAQWLGEDEDIDDSGLTFDDVELKPKTVGAISSYSRKTLINASPSIEQIVRNDLASIIANAIDSAAMLGDGQSNKPLGIVAQNNVKEVDLSGGATWGKILEFVASIDGADAAIGNLGWALNAWAVKKLRGVTRVDSDGSAGFLMESPNALAGYGAVTTSALPGVAGDSPIAATLIFGAWSQLLVGYWSGTDLLVNPYSDQAYARGRVLVRAMRDCDVAVRHPEAFAFADNMAVTDEA